MKTSHNPLNNVISQPRFGNRTSAFEFWDNSPIGEYILDALETFPPEDGLSQLKRLYKELGDKITSLEGPSKAWDAPNTPPRQVAPGILMNPFQGRVDRVDKKSIPLKSGELGWVYKVHTGAARFETYHEPFAIQADFAQKNGLEIQVKWKMRIKADKRNPAVKHTNYDIVSLRVLSPHGRT